MNIGDSDISKKLRTRRYVTDLPERLIESVGSKTNMITTMQNASRLTD